MAVKYNHLGNTNAIDGISDPGILTESLIFESLLSASAVNVIVNLRIRMDCIELNRRSSDRNRMMMSNLQDQVATVRTGS